MSIADKQKTLRRVRRLLALYEEGKIPTPPQHEVHPRLKKSSRENYLYFTLPPAINFQRNSPAMWRSALAAWDDPTTNYLFFPEKVVKQKREKIQKDLSKHSLALQRNKHTDIWVTISETLHAHFGDDPRNILKESEFDVQKVLEIVQGERKKQFPYLSGIKMSNYWLYILTCYTGVKFSSPQEISIIPDTHVMKATVELGLSGGDASPEAIANIWKELLNDTKITPIELHPVLWNWSRAGFTPQV